MLLLLMMMMMTTTTTTTLMKLVNSGTKIRPGIDKFYQPNSGCAQFQEVGRGYIYNIYIYIHVLILRTKDFLCAFQSVLDSHPVSGQDAG